MKIQLVVLQVLLAAFAWAEPGPVQLRWEQLGARIVHHKVAFVLPDGTPVKGKVVAVEPDGLRLNGKRLVPRQSLSVLRVTEYRKLGRLVGALGAAAIAGGVAAATYPDLYEGVVVVVVPAVVAAGIAGSAIAGYYTGKAFDKRITEIHIVP